VIIVLHSLGRAPHVHQYHRRIALSNNTPHFRVKTQSAYIIDHFSASSKRPAGYFCFRGIN
jgi:hypothetical protein